MDCVQFVCVNSMVKDTREVRWTTRRGVHRTQSRVLRAREKTADAFGRSIVWSFSRFLSFSVFRKKKDAVRTREGADEIFVRIFAS